MATVFLEELTGVETKNLFCPDIAPDGSASREINDSRPPKEVPPVLIETPAPLLNERFT
jgi:hypothetical protein